MRDTCSVFDGMASHNPQPFGTVFGDHFGGYSQITSFAGTLIQRNIPLFDWSVMLAMVAGGILGGIIGRGFSRRMNPKRIEWVIYVLLVIIMSSSLYNLASFSTML